MVPDLIHFSSVTFEKQPGTKPAFSLFNSCFLAASKFLSTPFSQFQLCMKSIRSESFLLCCESTLTGLRLNLSSRWRGFLGSWYSMISFIIASFTSARFKSWEYSGEKERLVKLLVQPLSLIARLDSNTCKQIRIIKIKVVSYFFWANESELRTLLCHTFFKVLSFEKSGGTGTSHSVS